jgi:hypothetical protein
MAPDSNKTALAAMRQELDVIEVIGIEKLTFGSERQLSTEGFRLEP